MRRRPTIDYVGSMLVLLVVVLVPTFLGVLSSNTLPIHDAVLTTADASAAALSALDQQIQNKTLPPIHALAAAPAWWNVARDATPALSDFPAFTTTQATDIATEPARLL